jgi:alkylation response protein AidB-like acyl-CoA dehydrogenase
MSSYKVVTPEDVEKHNTEKDCWMSILGKVYDVTPFLSEHPGGKKILLKFAGKDATKEFSQFHQVNAVIQKYGSRLQVAVLEDTKPSQTSYSFDSTLPFTEPAWYLSFNSPYYNDSHRAWRDKVRHFVETELMPYAEEWEIKQDYPRELHEKAYKAGIYGSNWPVEYGGTPPENYDIFHELVFWDEVARSTSGGLTAALFLTIAIALPPILSDGSDYLKNKVARDVITGKKIIALCITEPGAGSDVASIETTAVRDGDHFVVSGSKKFITSGIKGDYYVVAVRTGTRGMGGISLLLMERNMPGIKVTKLATTGWWASNTALIVFEDVRVPVEYLIGTENHGFKAIMLNFNHERWVGIAMAIRAGRGCIQEAIRYGRTRKTFGKRLLDHQVLRHKIIEMATRVELAQNMLDTICYQIHTGVDPITIGKYIALLKANTTKTMQFCAIEASQIIGGASCLRTGPGAIVERIYRDARIAAIGGGSEEVMLDLASRLAKL